MAEGLTERDLDLIEVALESALSAVASPIGNEDMTGLAEEYQHALDRVREWRKVQ